MSRHDPAVNLFTPPPSFLVPALLNDIDGVAPSGHFDIGLVGDVYWRDDSPPGHSGYALRDVSESVWKPLESASLVVANLEGPITTQDTPVEQKLYLHRTTNPVVDTFDRRFVLCLANNHIMDYGPSGLFDTMAALDKRGIPYAGAGRDIDRAKTPRLLTIEDTTVAVICAADPRFNPAAPSQPGTCPAHAEILVDAIQSVARRARLIVVSLHMGLEHVRVPSTAQIRLAETCLGNGAHIVHFHHSHCSSGAALGRRGVVLFGTGNYVFTSVPRIKIPASRRTATWRVRFDACAGSITGLYVKPMALDQAGLPRALAGVDADRELKRLRRCSRYMLSAPRRKVRYLLDLLSPACLCFNVYNYSYLLRRRGLRFVLKEIYTGIRTQLGGGSRWQDVEK